jgi:hypothetical protein
MARKGKLVTNQETSERYDNSGNAYWNTVEREGTGESTLANPNLLQDDPENTVWGIGAKPELAELMIERFTDGNGKFSVLSKMENTVLSQYIQHGSVALVCKSLKISRSSCNTYLARSRRKLKRLLPLLNF